MDNKRSRKYRLRGDWIRSKFSPRRIPLSRFCLIICLGNSLYRRCPKEVKHPKPSRYKSQLKTTLKCRHRWKRYIRKLHLIRALLDLEIFLDLELPPPAVQIWVSSNQRGWSEQQKIKRFYFDHFLTRTHKILYIYWSKNKIKKLIMAMLNKFRKWAKKEKEIL